MIPTTLYFIWLGDSVPQYAAYSMNAFKDVNRRFDVEFIHYTSAMMRSLDKCKFSKYDEALQYSISSLNSNESRYSEYIVHQKNAYGMYLNTIQLLSDVFRVEVLNRFGGIYLDCDTFPVKPFDDEILSLSRFQVSREYGSGIVAPDNFFLGQEKCNSEDEYWVNPGVIGNGVRCVYVPSCRSRTRFYMSKYEFMHGQLSNTSSLTDTSTYIDHYFAGTWH